MFAEESASKVVDFHPTPSVQAVELEEAVLGAVLLDPGALVQVKELSIQAFSIWAHREIFKVMLELHFKGLQPDLPTVAFSLAEQEKLKQIGGQTKLASLLDRTVHSGHIKQYAALLEQKYQRQDLSDRINQIAHQLKTEKDIAWAIEQAHKQLKRISYVTSDTLTSGDISNLDPTSLPTTVNSVTQVLAKGLSEWEELAHLEAVQSTSGISKTSFWQLVSSLRCQSDEIMPADEQQLSQLIKWKNFKLDLKNVLPHLAEDLLHDARVLNIDPIMLWQYLLPATLSLIGKKVNLDVNSHQVPAIAWTCSVGESGIGKSRAEGVILSPLRAWQEAEYHRFKTEWSQHKQFQNKKDEATEAPPPLPERKFLFEVATIQAVMRRLSEQGENGSLWARDEIAGLFKSLGQFTAKGEGEGLECLLPMWDGTSAPVDRVLHEDSYHLDSSRLSIAGGLQPGMFRKIFTDPDDAQGIQARFLFALPKVQLSKRVKGYCHLSDKLPAFYRWVDTTFPAGNIKLSSSADARYDAVYESIGRSAETATTPAVRAWMRKLPGQLLRIALALHIIECYHQPSRPRHELQLDTLNRAVDLCRYYRSTFEVVQQVASDSDAIGSILLKIWDLAATSPTGLAVRDAYRSIKALTRRAKELGRNVAAYTIDLYYQLEKMGKGSVQRCGRRVRFIVGETNPLAIPDDGIDAVTLETVAKTTPKQGLVMSLSDQVSPVTEQDFGQVDTTTDDGTQLLNQAQLQRWLDRIAAVCDAHECMSCEDAINSLPSPVVEQIWGAASELLPRFCQVAEDELAIEGTEVVKRKSNKSNTNAQVQAATGEIGEIVDSFNISGQTNEAICSSSVQQFTNSNTQTLANTCTSASGGITNSTPIAPTELQQSQTAQELAVLILQCQNWMELVQFVGDRGELLKAAATTMTPQERQSLVCLLEVHLCQNPTYLNQLAWVPTKLRQRALERLQFTIRQIRGVASSVLDAYVEYVAACKFVSISYLGTAYEKWVFQTPDGATLLVEVDAVEAISCNQM